MYLIEETQKRKDGVINVQPTVSRETTESAMSYFYERCSKMSATEVYEWVAVKICDERLKEIDRKIFEKHVEEVAETVE